MLQTQAKNRSGISLAVITKGFDDKTEPAGRLFCLCPMVLFNVSLGQKIHRRDAEFQPPFFVFLGVLSVCAVIV